MENWMVETRALKKYYKLGDNTVKALDDVNFRVREQEFVAIIGKSEVVKAHFYICLEDLMCRQAERSVSQAGILPG